MARDASEPRPLSEAEMSKVSIESLRLIVQSQMILADLVRNQHRLENLIVDLEDTTERVNRDRR